MARKRKKKRSSGLGVNISRFNVQRFTLRELKGARRNGLRTKKPKKPKTKSIEALQNYIRKYNTWVSQIKSNAKSHQTVMQLRGLVGRI